MNDIIRRLERDHPALLRALVDELNSSDLQSLLLEVIRRRSWKRSTADVVSEFSKSRFYAPASVEFGRLLEWDNLANEVARNKFELLELSPLAPLGTCSLMAKVDQNWSVATVRKGEMVSDTTNILAAEAAVRRKKQLGDIHIGASSRVIRPQNYKTPGLLAHFRLFGLVSAGRDRGGMKFEAEALHRHLEFYCDAFRRFIPDVKLKLAVTGDALLATAQDFAAHRGLAFATENRDAADGYYAGFCFHIYADDSNGIGRQLVDGGLVNWGAVLTNNAKERMLISGAGVEGILDHQTDGPKKPRQNTSDS